MKLICTLCEFAKLTSATLPRYRAGAGGSRGRCLHSRSRGSGPLSRVNRARRGDGLYPAVRNARSKASTESAGCKTPSPRAALDSADADRFSQTKPGNASVAPADCGARVSSARAAEEPPVDSGVTS